MKNNFNYCPVVGKCSYENIRIIPKSFFLIEPFDNNKKKRENKISKGLKHYYGTGKYKLVTGDKEISTLGLYCDICKKIKACQACIADITPRKIGRKNNLSIKENVMFELGLAYGFKKPVIIISGKINGIRHIPTDLSFIRFLDNTSDVKYKNWDDLSKNLILYLSGVGSIGYYRRKIPDNQRDLLKKHIKHLRIIYHIKKYKNDINKKNIKIKYFSFDRDGHLIGIILKDELLKIGMPFTIIKIENEVEEAIGHLEIFHIQQNNIAQAYCYLDNIKDEENISDKAILSDDYFPAFNNVLQLHITEDYEEMPLERIANDIKKLESLL